MDAFDADVLIYAALGDSRGHRVARLFEIQVTEEPRHAVGVGSLVLLPEVLSKPLRDGSSAEVEALASFLSRLELRPLDRTTALLAVALAVTHGLRAADASHLATAVAAGADRFITNNRRDFPKRIEEIDVTYPEDLPDGPA